LGKGKGGCEEMGWSCTEWRPTAALRIWNPLYMDDVKMRGGISTTCDTCV
jgi:hypothetical protein